MEKKNIKKEKVTKVKKEDNKKLFINKDYKMIIKTIAYIATFAASILAILIFVFGIITTLSVTKGDTSKVVQDNFTVTFVSTISNSTIEETKLSMMTMESKFVYAIFNVVLPSIAFVCGCILIILLSYLIITFTNKIKKEEDLFNNKSIKIVENMINILSLIVFINWVLFNQPSFPFLLLVYLLLYVSYYLFKKCVSKYEEK